MTVCKNLFTEWYLKKQDHKKLKWIYALGDLEVKLTVGKYSCTMQLTPLQGVVLQLFDGVSTALTFEEISSTKRYMFILYQYYYFTL